VQNKLRIGPGGLALLKSEEALRLTPYNDAHGFATVGYGHLIRRGPVEPTDQSITLAQALAFLDADLAVPEDVVNEKVTAQLNQNQFDAVVDFVYNEGAGNFNTSSLLRYLNSLTVSITGYDPARIKYLFGLFDEAGGQILPGLVTRRFKEAELFNTGGK
jgi:lysozyme